MKPGLTLGSRIRSGYPSNSGMDTRLCPICKSRRLRASYKLPEFTVVSCDDCGHGMTIYTEIVADAQERFRGSRWIETRGIMESVTSAMAAHRYAELRAFDPGRDLLEVGCGTGEFLIAARSAGHAVIGLDLSQEAISYVRRRHPDLDVRCNAMETARLPAASVDVIAAFHVLEHVADPIGLLLQMQRLLRPGGLVYIRVPNLDTWYRRVLGRNWGGFSVDHVSHFTGDSISRAFTAASLDILAVRSADSDPQHSLWPVVPLLVRRGVVLRSLGSALRPPSGPSTEGGTRLNGISRTAIKRWLIGAYLGYRRVGSTALAPLIRVQLEKGGGPELLILGRKR
jgi:SAM-dependent methyltransferase